MKLFKYLILTIGFLYHHVEAKAFRTNEENAKGTFDHMKENLYLKEIPGGYEMQYVPHVDGKPIFIPFDEKIPPPDVLKVRPTKMYQSSIPKNDIKNVHFEPNVKRKDIKSTGLPFKTLEYQKTGKDSETKQTPADHPLVIDVVTKADNLKNDHDTVIIRPVNKKPEVTKPVKIKSSEQVDHPLVIDVVTKSVHLKDHDTAIIRPIKKKPEVTKPVNIKSSEQETYKTGGYAVNTKKEANTDSLLKYDPDKVSKHKVKEKMSNNYEKKDGILIHEDYDSPIVLGSLTKESLSEKHAESIKNKVINKKPVQKYYNEKPDTKISEKISQFGKVNFDADNGEILVPIKSQSGIENEAVDYPFEESLENKSTDLFSPVERDYSQDYDNPVIVEALVKKNQDSTNIAEKTEMMHDSPVIVEALVKKTNVKKDPIKKYPIESQPHKYEEDSDDSYAIPVVEALVNKNPLKLNEKGVKFSTDTENTKSNLVNFQSTPQNKLSNSEEDSSIETSEMFLNDDLFSADNDQFDAGSGIINERSSERFSNSNLWPLLASFHSQERNKFKKCLTPNDERGNCMPIQLCPTPNLQLTLDDLMKKICAIDEVFIGICCPEFPAETLKVDWDKNISSEAPETFETKSEGCGKIQEESDSWPWMAPLISLSTRKIFCGGVLIKPQYVLTAAHCTRKIPHNQIVVVLGPYSNDTTPQEFEVIEIKRHAQYNPRTMQYDIALLKLARKVPRPIICLPREETFVGMEALMLGWRGTFTSSKIEEKLLVLSPKECPKGVGDILCTETRTEDVMCNVDSGAPLILKHNESYEVIGLLTWNRNDCNFPALFTRVSHFKGWIENHSSF